MTYASAGRGYLLNATGHLKVLEATGLPLAVDEEEAVSSGLPVVLSDDDLNRQHRRNDVI